jgi:RHS repeat-associated protein
MRYGHNPYAELTSSAAWYGTDSLLTARYDRDALGRITRIVETTAAGTTDRGYYYDARGRLETVRDSSMQVDIARYRYDANGNRLGLLTATDSVTAAYDEQDRLVDRGNAHYTYTASGERLARTQSGATVSTTYDLLGNLVQVKLASGDSVEYVIDGKNRRVGRKFNGTLTARWVYANDLSVVGELDTAGVLTKRFVYASSSHVPDLMVVRNPSGPDSTYRFVTDHLGSVRLVVNANTGIVAQRLAYDAWGVVTSDTQPGFTPFGYAGGLYDPATALVRFGARDYDPEAGVWTCKDPVGFGGGSTNLLTYVENDPTNRIDPSGHDNAFSVVYDWFFERGRNPRTYGPGDAVTQELMRGAGVEEARRAYKAKGCAGTFEYHYRFGVNDYVRDLLSQDVTGSVLGSYTVSITRAPGGNKIYSVTNISGWESATRSPIPSAAGNASLEDMMRGRAPWSVNPKSILNNRERAAAGAGGNFTQIYRWVEP